MAPKTLDRHPNPNLQAHYDRNADACGHSAGCRRRIVPTLTSDSLALDPERCDRCRYLIARLDDSRTSRQVAALQYAAAAQAHGYDPDAPHRLPDAAHRERFPGEWCGCSHHITEHYGEEGDGACSADGCSCDAFRPTC